jgi:hypothetical protein
MAHQITLMRSRIATLQNANKAATERRKRKKKRIQKEGALRVAEGLDLIAQAEVDEQVVGETREGKRRESGNASQQRRCRRCKETGHNSRTCKQAEK